MWNKQCKNGLLLSFRSEETLSFIKKEQLSELFFNPEREEQKSNQKHGDFSQLTKFKGWSVS